MTEPADMLARKVCLITGATSGIGAVTARELARRGAETYLLCRHPGKGTRIANQITALTGNSNVQVLPCDMSSLAEIRAAADAFLNRNKPLHLLVNNAGVFNTKRRLSKDGHEEMFAVNHLAHFLLTNLLLDRITAGAPARIVNVASGAHMLVRGMNFEDLQFESGFRPLHVYSHSKLANILFNLELARRLEGSRVVTNALDPGAVATELGAQNRGLGKALQRLLKPFLVSPERGAKTTIHLCTSNALEGVNGRYFKDCRITAPKPWADDAVAAKRLWKISEGLTL